MAVAASPFFSVIVPSWNRGALLERCLGSVVAQDFTDYEILVVDGGSTDDTAQVLQRFAPRVAAIRQHGTGPSDARNQGAAAATGRFIVFVDSDDLLARSALGLYASLLHADSAPLMLAAFRPFTDERELDGFDRPLAAPSVRRFETYLDAASAGHLSGTHRLIIERSMYLAARGLSTDFRVCEDQDFGLRINQTGPCLVILSPATVAYRAHAGNISQDIADFGRGIRRIIAAEHRGAYPGPAQARRAVITSTSRSTSVGCLRQGFFSHGLAIYLATFGWNLQQGRLKYLFGFPLRAVGELARRRS